MISFFIILDICNSLTQPIKPPFFEVLEMLKIFAVFSKPTLLILFVNLFSVSLKLSEIFSVKNISERL